MAKLKEVSAEEEEESLGIKTNQLFGDWKIVKKLDEAESSKSIGGAAIKLEIAVLELLNKNNSKMYVPQLFRARRRKKFHYMVVTLLGENLRSLRTDSKTGRISAETWSRLAIQCLYGIKLVHEIGYIHRDIKPPNFVMGHRSDVNRVRVVHVLDFGMARHFARFDGNKWIVRKARPSCDFRGTYRYCSPMCMRDVNNRERMISGH
uniref:non-specific serine/threonine protein kinase n=1 Tax=Ditylenchus dipsaci TaxID=166011 RepID=A0A915CXR0_9BILA